MASDTGKKKASSNKGASTGRKMTSASKGTTQKASMSKNIPGKNLKANKLLKANNLKANPKTYKESNKAGSEKTKKAILEKNIRAKASSATAEKFSKLGGNKTSGGNKASGGNKVSELNKVTGGNKASKISTEKNIGQAAQKPSKVSSDKRASSDKTAKGTAEKNTNIDIGKTDIGKTTKIDSGKISKIDSGKTSKFMTPEKTSKPSKIAKTPIIPFEQKASNASNASAPSISSAASKIPSETNTLVDSFMTSSSSSMRSSSSSESSSEPSDFSADSSTESFSEAYSDSEAYPETFTESKPSATSTYSPITTTSHTAQDSMMPYKFEAYQPKKKESYMNDEQLNHFRHILDTWKKDLMKEVDNTISEMKEATVLADPNDRATQEEAFNLELRTRDRERKLIRKIEEALQLIEAKEYGYCESCGVEIGIRRLEARPTAFLCIDCKTLDEIRERNVQ